MKPTGARRLLILPLVYRTLIICLITLGVIIIGGTIYGLFIRTSPPPGQTELLPENGARIFTGIGRVRVSTMPITQAAAVDSEPAVAILFVSFPYNPEDRAFSEELALRIRDFRDIIRDYIGSFSSAGLREQSEEIIKTELLRRFNAILRLGQIETLFFSDFMVID